MAHPLSRVHRVADVPPDGRMTAIVSQIVTWQAYSLSFRSVKGRGAEERIPPVNDPRGDTRGDVPQAGSLSDPLSPFFRLTAWDAGSIEVVRYASTESSLAVSIVLADCLPRTVCARSPTGTKYARPFPAPEIVAGDCASLRQGGLCECELEQGHDTVPVRCRLVRLQEERCHE
jgi:hypothetical protein